MRRHMVARHGMSKEEVDSVTNTKVKVSHQYLRQVYTGYLPGAVDMDLEASVSSSANDNAFSVPPANPARTDSS